MKLFKTTILLAATILALVAPPARGGAWEDFTWDGEYDQYWDTQNGSNTNWEPDNGINYPIPTFNDNIFFNGASPYTTIELQGPRRVLSVNFSGSTNYTLEESTFLDTLGLVTGNINASGGATHTITAKTVLEEDGDWAISGTNTLLRVTGVVNGAFALNKTGSGTLDLDGANTYSGRTTIGGGVIGVSADSGLGASTGPLTFDGGKLRFNAAFDLASARTITLDAGGGTLDTNGHSTAISQAIGGAGGLTKLDAGTLTLTGTNTYTGGSTVYFGALQIGSGGTSGSILGDVANNASLIFNRSDDLTFSGAISGVGSLTKSGAGTLTLGGTNTYTGGTIIEDGTLSISSNGNLGDTSGTVTFRGGALEIDAAFFTELPTGRHLVTDGADAVIDVSGGPAAILGGISGDGGLVMSGGALFLKNTPSTYSGDTTINSGQLTTLDAEGLPDTTNLILNSGSNWSIQNGGTETIGSLSGSGSIRFDLTTGTHLRIGANNNDTTYNGDIITVGAGDGQLTKIGKGTLTLTGDSTYTEGTTIDGGTLLANNTSGSATGTGAVQVNSGGTLGGTGSVAGAVTVASGGTLTMGASPGSLSLGGLTLESESILAIELSGLVQGVDYDFLDVTGNVGLNGLLDVSLIDPFALGDYQQFDILSVGGKLSGQFTRLGEGGLVDNFGGTDLFITYAAGDGNDVALYTVPEPATMSLLCLGGLALLRRRRQ